MPLIEYFRRGATAVVASASFLAIAALPAQAHNDQQGVRAACGKGYEIVERRDIRQYYNGGTYYRTAGRLIIARRRNAPGFVCAVTKSNSTWVEHGAPVGMKVEFCRQNYSGSGCTKEGENHNYNAKHWVKIKFTAGTGQRFFVRGLIGYQFEDDRIAAGNHLFYCLRGC